MILKDLKLIGFGKFENRSLELKEGINIIYGENESGKTTIHSFIDGMFYGFLKPYVKSTKYLEEHNKFNPWNANRYAGIINFNVNGEDYRIERTFTKNKEETKVLLENTGEDITYKINNGNKGRVLQPGLHFFGLSDGVYSNTVSIKQLETRTDDNLANEVRDKLVNITSALDDKISVENSIKDLEKSLKEIGTIKAPTSIYGITNNNLSKLKEERKEILELKMEYEKLMDNDNNLGNNLVDLNKELDREKSLYKIAEYHDIKLRHNEAINISEAISNLEKKLEKYKIFKDLCNDDYSNGVNYLNEIKVLCNKIEDAQTHANEVEDMITNIIRDKDNFDNIKFEELSNDYVTFDMMEEDKNKLIYGKENSKLEFLKRDYKEIQKAKIQMIIGIVLLSILYMAIMYISIGKVLLPLMKLYHLLTVPVVFLVIKLMQTKKLTLSIDKQITNLNLEEVHKKQELEKIEFHQKSLLDKYNITSKVEFKNQYNNLQQSRFRYDEELKQLAENQSKLSNLKNKARSLNIEKQEVEVKLQEILSMNSVNNLEEFEIGLNNKNNYNDLFVEHGNKTELLRRILGTFTIDDLKGELDSHFIEYKLDDLESKDIIQGRIENLKQALSSLRLEKKGVEERINFLTPKISKLVEIEEEISRGEMYLTSLDRKREALELSKTTIEKLSKDIHNQFAPEINKKVSVLVNRITGGKYSRVKIDNKLDIGVINPTTGEIINVNTLSGGTIDQLYFSLRFGIINSITGDILPLILDDCFIQYDDNRLSNILQFLVDISKERQIILFSCHNRERVILERMGIDFNLITLSEVIH